MQITFHYYIRWFKPSKAKEDSFFLHCTFPDLPCLAYINEKVVWPCYPIIQHNCHGCSRAVHTCRLLMTNFLKPSGSVFLVFLLVPYPTLGIRYWPLNLLLTLLSIPLGFLQFSCKARTLSQALHVVLSHFTTSYLHFLVSVRLMPDKLFRSFFYAPHRSDRGGHSLQQRHYNKMIELCQMRD